MLHTLLIAFAIVGSIAAIVALCIIVTKRQTRRKTQHLQDSYRSLISEHNITPDFSQIFEHRIFAFDTTRQVFVFVQDDEAQPSAIVALADVADCRLWKDGIQITRKNGARGESVEEYISSVGLSFKRKSGVVTNVPVYTEVLDGIEEKIRLSKVADQWIQRINAALSDTSYSRRLTSAH